MIFPIYPDARPGIGLVILRIALAGYLFWRAYTYFRLSQSGHLTLLGFALILVLIAICLLLGRFTLPCSLLAALVGGGSLFGALSSSQDLCSTKLGAEFAIMIAIALACLGPGAYSLDARRYGRREIIIPRRTEPPVSND